MIKIQHVEQAAKMTRRLEHLQNDLLPIVRDANLIQLGHVTLGVGIAADVGHVPISTTCRGKVRGELVEAVQREIDRITSELRELGVEVGP